MDLLFTLNFVIAVASLGLGVFTVGLVIDYVFYKGRYCDDLLAEIAWPMVLVVTIGSVALSLVYSEYFGFIPCSLCWLQRIAIYPQALMAVVAYRLNDQRFFPVYGIVLSTFGLLVALYQYLYQMLPKSSLGEGVMPCLADGSNADCAVKVINEFGFVTFPLVSAIAFAFLIMVYLYVLRQNRV